MKKKVAHIICVFLAMILCASSGIAEALDSKSLKAAETPRGFVKLYNEKLIDKVIGNLFSSQPKDKLKALKESFHLHESEFHALMFDENPTYAGAMSYGMAFAVTFECENTAFIAKEDRYAPRMKLVWFAEKDKAQELVFYVVSYLFAYSTGAGTQDCQDVARWASAIPFKSGASDLDIDMPTLTATYSEDDHSSILFYRKTPAEQATDWPSYVVANAEAFYEDVNTYGQLWPSAYTLSKAAGVSLIDFVKVESCEIDSPSQTRPTVLFKGNFQGRNSASDPFVKYNFTARVQCTVNDYGYIDVDLTNARITVEKP